MAHEDQQALWRASHLVALYALAVCQPTFELIARHPTFLTVHQADAAVVVGFAAVFAALLPLVLWLAARPLERTQVALGVPIFLLVWALVQPPINRAAPGLPTFQPLAALAAAVLVFALLRRAAPLRRVLALLAVSPLLMAALFLASPQVRPFWRPQPPSTSPAAVPAGTTLVFVLFDELPLLTLLDPDGEVDRGHFPHFAALADTATWYRGATSVGTRTEIAVSALLQADYPRRRPREGVGNLFQAFGPGAVFDVREELTSLCPAELCQRRPAKGGLPSRLGRLLEDWSAIYLHALLPEGARGRLPPLEGVWRDFWRWQVPTDRYRRALGFIDALPSDRERRRAEGAPRLIYQHIVLPHHPFEHLPDGRMFPNAAVFTIGTGDEPADRAQLYQLHLLQAQAADDLLGRLRRRLEELGLWDDAWVVVTADHGLSLRPGHRLRGSEDLEALRAEVLPVPLFVKEGGRGHGEVDDRPLEHVDLLPTLFERLGASWPFAHDGRVLPRNPAAALAPSPETARAFGASEGDWAAAASAFAAAKAWKFALPGLNAEPGSYFAMSPRPELYGRPAPPAAPSTLRAYLWSTRSTLDYHAAATANDLLVLGELSFGEGAAAPPADAVVTVAVGGVVRGIGALRRPQLIGPAKAWRDRRAKPGAGGPYLFSCILDPAHLREGRNELELALVAGGEMPQRLAVEPLFTADDR